MSEQTKKSKNVTVNQIIDNMTADLQNADGQYIQLGFTPPPTPNDNVSWGEFQQNQHQSNPFVPHYTPRTSEGLNYPMEANSRQYMPQNLNYGGYIPQSPIYMSELPPNYNKDPKKYVLYHGQAPQYLLNQGGYVPVFPETNNRDYGFSNNQEPQNAHFQSNQMMGNPQNIINENILPQNRQNIQKHQNRNHLIDHLVGNWAQNTNGTYSPFGNVPQHKVQKNFYECPNDLPQNSVPLVENQSQNFSEVPPERNDFNISFTTNKSGKKKQIAEVKPMRPTYSDVLTKSVPQPPKFEKNYDITSKNKSVKKNPKFSSKITNNVNRQNSNGNDKENILLNQSLKADKVEKTNLGRKWVSLDDVNEVTHQSSSLFKDVSPDIPGKNSSAKKNNNTFPKKSLEKDGYSNLKSNSENLLKNGVKKNGFLDNATLECQWNATENGEECDENLKNDDRYIGKNPSKKGKESRSNSLRQLRERGNEKPPGSGKRTQRIRKRENNGHFAMLVCTLQHYLSKWSKVLFKFLLWLLHLISDIFSMSVHLARDFGTMFWDSMLLYSKSFAENTSALLKKITIFSKIGGYIDRTFGEYRWAFWRKKQEERRNSKTEGKTWLNSGLEHNIQMPQTGEEAMKRLLACKGKDPYSILGVRPDCTDDDIKRYYKRQAFLVHPDKNPQPGAEEAFKILVHAFDIIGEPERRQSYDRKVAESHQVEQAWSELNDLLSQLHQKMEYAANTIRCTNCSKRHRRLNVNRPCYAARMCSQCKIHHSAKEGDIWAESKYFGFLWHYYACMDGAVYDITEWAGCQRKNLKHLRPNSHNVQYRIVLGKQGQAGGPSREGKRHKTSGNTTDREADLENFLNNLYNQSDLSSGGQSPPHSDINARSSTESAKCRKKNKRKK